MHVRQALDHTYCHNRSAQTVHDHPALLALVHSQIEAGGAPIGLYVNKNI